MDASVFITLAYAAAGVLIAALSLTTWLKARSVRRQLEHHQS